MQLLSSTLWTLVFPSANEEVADFGLSTQILSSNLLCPPFLGKS